MKLFGYTLGELQAAVIAALYLAFAIVMLFIIPPVGFEQAVIAVAPALFGVINVFGATEHTPGDMQKALEALWATVGSAITFYTVVPASTNECITMLITGAVMALGVLWTRKGTVSRTA